jgi:hypothetical protein
VEVVEREEERGGNRAWSGGENVGCGDEERWKKEKNKELVVLH